MAGGKHKKRSNRNQGYLASSKPSSPTTARYEYTNISEYQEADGEGIPDPVAAEVEGEGTEGDSGPDENKPETVENADDEGDSAADEFAAEEESFDEDNPSPDAA